MANGNQKNGSDRTALSAGVDNVLKNMGLSRQAFANRTDASILDHLGQRFRASNSPIASLVATTAANAARKLDKQD